MDVDPVKGSFGFTDAPCVGAHPMTTCTVVGDAYVVACDATKGFTANLNLPASEQG